MIDYIGWIGNVFFLWGVYALGKKNILGFYANSIGNALYLWQAVIMNNPALMWLSIGLVMLNIKGVLEWRKNGKEKT